MAMLRSAKRVSYTYKSKCDGILYESIPQRLEYFSETCPDKVACVFVDQDGRRLEITYGDLYKKSVNFGKGLQTLSVERGDTIAVGLHNEPEWMLCTFGCQMIGAVPFYFKFKKRDGSDIEQLMQLAGNCKGIICDPGPENCNIEILKNIIKFNPGGNISGKQIPSLVFHISTSKNNQTSLTIDDVIRFGQTTENSRDVNVSTLNPDDVAGLLSSSGSTGVPKLIRHSHYSLLMMGFHWKTALDLTSEDVFLNDRTFNWIGGYPHVMLVCGLKLVTVCDFSKYGSLEEVNTWLGEIIDRESVTSALILGSCLQYMASHGVPKCKRLPLRTVGTGGRPITANSTLTSVGKLAHGIITLYGITEVGFISLKRMEMGAKQEDFEVGYPLPGVEIKVVNDLDQTVSPGTTGEICVRHPVIFQGYVNQEDKTREVFTSSGWYKTGDIGQINEDMSLFVAGRKSGSVIVGGVVVSLSYVESIINSHPFVCDVFVFPVASQDKEYANEICAAVIPKTDCKLTSEEVKKYISGQYITTNVREFRFIPKHILFFNDFPKTFNGKVDQKALMSKFEDLLP